MFRFQLYMAFIKSAFLEMMAYRLRYYTGIFTYLMFVSVNYFIWKAVYANQPEGANINGFSLNEMVTYVAIAWISRSLYFSNIDEKIEDLVRTGQISIYLLRPVNFQLMLLSKAFGESFFRLCFFSVPIAVVVFGFFPISPPKNLIYFSFFILATFGAFLVLALFNYLIGLLAFSFKSIDGVMRSKYFLVQLFSGMLLPISFFPEKAKIILETLPFKLIADVPLKVYLGKFEYVEMGNVFLNFIFWIVLLYLWGFFAAKRSFTKLSIQGG